MIITFVKAQAQLEKGLRTMSTNWNPNNESIMHRYWLNQLYRAIIFSPLNLDNTSDEYMTIRNKIYGILSGKYQIEWSGDISHFGWTPILRYLMNGKLNQLSAELSEAGITLDEMICQQLRTDVYSENASSTRRTYLRFTLNEIIYPK